MALVYFYLALLGVLIFCVVGAIVWEQLVLSRALRRYRRARKANKVKE